MSQVPSGCCLSNWIFGTLEEMIDHAEHDLALITYKPRNCLLCWMQRGCISIIEQAPGLGSCERSKRSLDLTQQCTMKIHLPTERTTANLTKNKKRLSLRWRVDIDKSSNWCPNNPCTSVHPSLYGSVNGIHFLEERGTAEAALLVRWFFWGAFSSPEGRPQRGRSFGPTWSHKKPERIQAAEYQGRMLKMEFGCNLVHLTKCSGNTFQLSYIFTRGEGWCVTQFRDTPSLGLACQGRI